MSEFDGGVTGVHWSEQELRLVSVLDKVGASGRLIAQIVNGLDCAPSPIAVKDEILIE